MNTIGYIEATTPLLIPALVFVYGACIGSFLNVCIMRMPAGVSILWPPSHASDGRRLEWWENIPIFAWLLLRGKDRVTGEKIGVRYLLVELITAGLFVTCWLTQDPIQALVGMFFVSLLIVGSFIDLDHMILPDSITIGGTVVGVLLSFWLPVLHFDPDSTQFFSDGFASGVYAMISAIVGAGLVVWIGELGEVVFRKPAMGFGDVKLVGCIGAFCGWQGAVFSIFGGALIGCVLLLPILILRRLFGGKEDEAKLESELSDESKNEDKPEEVEGEFGREIPFGPMLALGGFAYFIGLSQWVDPYFAMLKDMVFGV